MDVQVERFIEQIKEGIHYKGSITFGGVSLEYEVVFGRHILEVDNSTSKIKLTVDSKEVNKEMKEYFFFLQLLAGFAVDFFYSKQVQDTQHVENVLQEFGAQASWVTISTSITSTSFFEFHPELCAMLTEKFNCSF